MTVREMVKSERLKRSERVVTWVNGIRGVYRVADLLTVCGDMLCVKLFAGVYRLSEKKGVWNA